MAAVASRHRPHGNYAPAQKPLPITMPSKPSGMNYPQARVAFSPVEGSDVSTYSSRGSRHSAGSYSVSSYAGSQSSNDDYSYQSASGVDVVDMLSERMDRAFDPIRMDRNLVKQTQT